MPAPDGRGRKVSRASPGPRTAPRVCQLMPGVQTTGLFQKPSRFPQNLKNKHTHTNPPAQTRWAVPTGSWHQDHIAPRTLVGCYLILEKSYQWRFFDKRCGFTCPAARLTGSTQSTNTTQGRPGGSDAPFWKECPWRGRFGRAEISSLRSQRHTRKSHQPGDRPATMRADRRTAQPPTPVPPSRKVSEPERFHLKNGGAGLVTRGRPRGARRRESLWLFISRG